MSHYRFQIEPRSRLLGGGWRLRLLEQETDREEIELGGVVFPTEDGIAEDDAYACQIHFYLQLIQRYSQLRVTRTPPTPINTGL